MNEMCRTLCVSFLYLCIFIVCRMRTEVASDSYSRRREELISQEAMVFVGGNITLTSVEQQVNDIILKWKHRELDAAYANSTDFPASLHFFKGKTLIERSQVFRIIRQMPKGASLHTHLLAAVSADHLIDRISYKPHLYGGIINDIYKLRFFLDPKMDVRTEWTSLDTERENGRAGIFDQSLRDKLILNVPDPEVAYPNQESIWKRFKAIFSTPYEMICHRPIFQDYIYQLLKELCDDNVFYTELKGSLMELYELNGTKYSHREFIQIFRESVARFKEDYNEFIGARFIVAIYRGVDSATLRKSIDDVLELKRLFPDVIAGIDLVGFEDEGKLLEDHHELLLDAKKSLKLFLHAGETSWFGHTDLNLVDAILLNASRIGHAFALTKHPVLKRMLLEQNIAIELAPLSNQVLKLNSDPRNHPMASLIAEGFPIVVCNDDPSAWNATGLSYDFYVTFMAMTSRNTGLAFLKQLCLNSIIYSSMGEEERAKAMEWWNVIWNNFLQQIISGQMYGT